MHVSDEDLLQAADGELTPSEVAAVDRHLAACWTCRVRKRKLESAITSFVETCHCTVLPPAGGARALLKLQMRERLAAAPVTWWRPPFAGALRLGVCAVLVLTVLAAIVMWRAPSGRSAMTFAAIPDPALTPGATVPITREELCSEDAVDAVRVVPAPVALQVFAAYGIHEPAPRAYELDYLITPALGGGDNIRNVWPQPYGTAVWNAHIKDALEDHLHRMVCDAKLDLATAQRDISQDWVSAYKRYFRTENPLPQHLSFLKDRPWEQ